MAKQESLWRRFVSALFWFLIIQSTFPCLPASESSKNPSSCIESEREALLSFKAGLTDPTNLLSSWEGKECCTWWGVSCSNKTSHIVGLNLHRTYDELHTNHSWLGGEINPSLLHLKHLRRIDLSFNNFSGTSIPEFIGSFENLRYLNLSAAGFVGLIPPQLGNLSLLRYLDLNAIPFDLYESYEDKLYVDNLRWLPHLSSLKYLDMSSVNLTRARNWLKMVNMLPSLTTLNLAHCQLDTFSGSLSYLNFTSLNTLDLSYNNFDSTLPHWLGNLTSLTHLDLSNPRFPSLHVDNLKWLPRLSSLKYLDLSQVNLTEVVDWFQMVNMLPSLTTLVLYGCGLQFIPSSFLSYVNSTSVNTLYLSNNNFNSTLPQWLWNLTNLIYLDLSGNSFHGPIPDDVGNLVSLEDLELSYNNLDGMIPRTITNLCSLNTLNLAMNKIRGDIGGLVNSLWNCTIYRLQFLRLSDNQLSGKLTSGIEQMRSLEHLDLANNQLDGPIPVEIAKLSHLNYISLYNNSFYGVVSEAHFANVTNLKWLDLSTNSLTISVDGSWVPSFQLESIGLESCQMGPHFPSWLQNQMEVHSLLLSNCSFSGIVPDWFWKKLSPSIQFLDLSYNNFSGKLPQSMEVYKESWIYLNSNHFEGPVPPCLLSKAEILDLSNNSFSGPLPNIKGPQSFSLDLSNNHFNSSIPSSLCQVRYFLDLSNNDFSGEIPNEWQMQSLSYIILANNHLSGRIPNTIGFVTNLEALILRNNSLSGSFPRSLQTCNDLILLDLGQNIFSGNIPTWLGENLTSLSFLSLRSNLFSGNIPRQFGQFRNLFFLDLAHNNLSGPIPPLRSFSAMTSNFLHVLSYTSAGVGYKYYPYYVSLLEITKGEELDYSTNHYLIKSIDLSYNYLIGEIPEDIGALIGLMNLNLSRNYLKGNIPENIGKMRSLESLDLSKNNLSGNIPLSISNLHSLSYLNLSYNHLSGRIPSGNQLQTLTDPSIYAGNTDLCGPPLAKNCSSNKTFEGSIGAYVEGDNERIWLYYSIGLGYIVGFWAVCGVLLFKKTWRYAYFRFIDNMYDWLFVVVSLTLAKLKMTMIQRD